MSVCIQLSPLIAVILPACVYVMYGMENCSAEKIPHIIGTAFEKEKVFFILTHGF